MKNARFCPMTGASRAMLALLVALVLTTFLPAAEDDSADKSSTESQFRAALAAIDQGDSKRAITLLYGVIKAKPSLAEAWYWRGSEHLRLGNLKQAIADFDKYIALRPMKAREQWKRGIALYLARRYAEGAKQFEDYQTYHGNDVENAVYRYLCVAGEKGVKAARANMLPIRNDRRVPMMEIYRMFKDTGDPSDVKQAAQAGNPGEAERNRRLFYAHFYIGLYQESQGNLEGARSHLKRAVKHKIGHYMHDLAQVHLQVLEKRIRDEG